MEKISKIIPASPRLTTVDMSKERPVRAGVPSFGAPVAKTDLDTRYTKLAIDEVPPVFDQVYGPDAKMVEKKHMKIIDDLASKFFNEKSKIDSAQDVQVEQKLDAIEPEIRAEIDETSFRNIPTSSEQGVSEYINPYEGSIEPTPQ